jgi:hypothetical protein
MKYEAVARFPHLAKGSPSVELGLLADPLRCDGLQKLMKPGLGRGKWMHKGTTA